MSIDETTRAEGSAAVIDRLKRLQEAVAAGGQYFDPFVSARAQDDLRRAQDRMRLGTDLTVVALVGGTGSGKSTLFNALTELEFADAGELRPTTERAAACTFNVNADALLDYLEVDADRRIDHESILTTGKDSLDGLVLLDLPDHDSIQLAHSAQVSRLIPMVDLLVWVVDPQKYADQILHQDYLKGLKSRSESMLVVLNQIDTVPQSQRDLIVEDLMQLLDHDGLGQVPVLTASALHGEGIEPIRDELRKAVHGPSATAKTAAAELDAIGRRLQFNLGDSEADVDGEIKTDINDRIARASGIPAVVESIRTSGESMSAPAFVAPEQPGNTMVVAIRDAWLGHVRAGLPQIWQEAATEDVASAERIRRSLGGALRGVELPKIDRGPSWMMMGLGAFLAVVGIVLAVIGIPEPMGGRIAVAIGGFALGGLLVWFARRRLVSESRKAADAYDERVRSAIEATTDELLIEGPRKVLDRHRTTREALADFA